MRTRVAASIMAVFMVQMVAAGFCMPSLSAAAVETSHEMMMSHCETSQATEIDHHHQSSDNAHSCIHCDLPDLSLTFDKDIQAFSHIAPDLLFVAFMPQLPSVSITGTSLYYSPPLRTSPVTFDLNLRIRV